MAVRFKSSKRRMWFMSWSLSVARGRGRKREKCQERRAREKCRANPRTDNPAFLNVRVWHTRYALPAGEERGSLNMKNLSVYRTVDSRSTVSRDLVFWTRTAISVMPCLSASKTHISTLVCTSPATASSTSTTATSASTATSSVASIRNPPSGHLIGLR